MLLHSLSKFKKTDIISSIFSNHNVMKPEINYKRKTAKNTNTWRLNNMLLSNKWIQEEIKNTWRLKKMNKQSKIYGLQQKQF